MYKSLTIAGSDSGGCAGIQADIKAMSACGVFAMSVITAVTAQNTKGVTHIEKMSVNSVIAQIKAIYDDLVPDTVKTGMLFSKDIIEAVADTLKEVNKAPLIVDPVMVATSGAKLLEDDAVSIMLEKLLPLAYIVTPNIPEAEIMANMKISNYDDIRAAAKKIHSYGVQNVLIKGGHLVEESESTDYLYDGESFLELVADRVNSKNTHGTGCTYSSAIAAFLAQGHRLTKSVELAKEYITMSIIQGANMDLGGAGSGAVNHFYKMNNSSSHGGCGGGCGCGC